MKFGKRCPQTKYRQTSFSINENIYAHTKRTILNLEASLHINFTYFKQLLSKRVDSLIINLSEKKIDDIFFE